VEVIARACFVQVFLSVASYELSQASVRWGIRTTEYERLLVSGLTEQVAIQAPLPCGSNQLLHACPRSYTYIALHLKRQEGEQAGS
jgi:hypothetical protein